MLMPRNYFGADPNALAAQQLATLFANPSMGFGYDRFGLDQIGVDALAADALAADALFGADPSPQNAAYRAQTQAKLANAMGMAGGGGGNPFASQQMQELQRKALAFAAGQKPFNATNQASKQVKKY